MGKLTNAEIVNIILEDDMINIKEDEEIIHLLLDKRISENTSNAGKDNLSFGNKIADKVAEVAGSWNFIITFCIIIFLWIALNIVLLSKPYDPYPFILLNLVLSCIAELQAPVIMMSQNRQEKKDRLRSENDYKVNLKSELIVEDLHLKIDKLINVQEQIILKLDSLDRK